MIEGEKHRCAELRDKRVLCVYCVGNEKKPFSFSPWDIFWVAQILPPLRLARRSPAGFNVLL